MRKFWSSVLLIILIAMFATACKKKPSEKIEMEITDVKEQMESNEEEVYTDIGFPGEVLEENDSDAEEVEIDADSKEESKENTNSMTEKNPENSNQMENQDADSKKENTYDGDLLEPVLNGSDSVL